MVWGYLLGGTKNMLEKGCYCEMDGYTVWYFGEQWSTTVVKTVQWCLSVVSCAHWCILCNVLVNVCNVKWSNVHILIILYSGKPPEAADQCTPLLAQATTIESLHTIPLLDHRPVLKNHQPKLFL